VDGRGEARRAGVVGFFGIDVEGEIRGVEHEAVVGQRRAAARLDEVVERAVQVGVEPGIGLPKRCPCCLIAGRQPGEDGRQRRVRKLQRIAGDDPHPGHAGGQHGRKGDDVVLDDDVRLDLGEDLTQALFDVDRTRD
jgi:hypothetical protein